MKIVNTDFSEVNKTINKLEVEFNKLESSIGSDSIFTNLANRLVVSIVIYCIEKEISIESEKSNLLDVHVIKELIGKTPGIFNELDDSSKAKQYFNKYLVSIRVEELFDSIRVSALSLIDAYNHNLYSR